MKILPVLVFSALVLALTSAEAKEKKSDEYFWDTTGLSTQLMLKHFKLFEEKLCYNSEARFRGCLAALNTVGSFAEPPIRAIPTNLVKDPALLVGEVVTSSFGLSLVKSKEMPVSASKQTLAQAREKQNELRKKLDAEIKTLFKFSVFTKINFNSLYQEVAKVALVDRTKDSLIAGESIAAFLREQNNDPHARLTPQEKLDEDVGDADENFFGIGATLQVLDEAVVVMDTLPGSPAEKGGLKAKDIFLGIKLLSLEEIEKKITDNLKVELDGFYSFQGMKLERVVQLIKGPEHSKMVLKVRRQGKDVSLPMARGKITIKNVESKIVNNLGRKYGHVKINSFMDSKLCSTLEKSIQEFENNRVEGIILDLRGNGGGLLDQAICMGGLFLGNQVIVQVKNLDSNEMLPMKSESSKITSLPVVTLIDSGSASASEVLSGALRDHSRSILVGVRSFGKGSVQSGRMFFNSKIVLFQTTQRFYQPSGTTNQVVGIDPDIEVQIKPDATEEEVFALREGDVFPTAMGAVGPKYQQHRAPVVQQIQNCMTQGKLALQEYSAAKKEVRFADYQLLAAQEALICQTR